MNDPASRDWHIGYQRLLDSPRDLRPCGARVPETPEDAHGSPAHQRLFEEYSAALAGATNVAMKWWDRMMAHQLKRINNRDRVLRDVWRMFPAGPASEPVLISAVRKFWLACDAINQTCPQDQRISPEVFLLRWPVRAGKHESIRILTYMPYWPMGLDRDGNWT